MFFACFSGATPFACFFVWTVQRQTLHLQSELSSLPLRARFGSLAALCIGGLLFWLLLPAVDSIAAPQRAPPGSYYCAYAKYLVISRTL